MHKRSNQKPPPIEIYPLDRSPFAQRPTQRDIAQLAKVNPNELLMQVLFKETCIVRRVQKSRGKERKLAYPVGPLRATHERWKYHLNKIEQPGYLMSPRKGRSQRDNAAAHLARNAFFTLDLKQFYPSTTYHMIYRYLVDNLNMYKDVARRIAGIATVDGVVSFGSPLTPVLVSLVHRDMFDQIAAYCSERRLSMTVWVDDITISGEKIIGADVRAVRSIIAENGHRSHKVAIRRGKGVRFITGVGVVGSHLVAPKALHHKIRDQWDEYHQATTFEGAEAASQSLLALMGTARHIVGKDTAAGQRLADRMNSLKQSRNKARRLEADKYASVIELNAVKCDSQETAWIE